MAKKYNIGDAELRVSPSTTGFKKELEAKLKAVGDVFFDVKLRPRWDEFIADLSTGLKLIEDASRIDIEVRADLATANATMRNFRTLQEANRIKQRVDVDTNGASAKLDTWRAVQGANDIDIDVDVDDERINNANRGMESLSDNARSASREVDRTADGARVVQNFMGMSLFNLSNIASAGVGIAFIGAELGGIVAAAAAAGSALAVVGGSVAVGMSGVIGAFSALKDEQKDVGSAAEDMGDKQAAAARKVEDAQDTMASATRRVKDAQDDLNRSIRDATRDYRDLRYSVEDTAISQAEAEVGVARARSQLRKVRGEQAVGKASNLDVTEAEVAVERAGFRLDESKRNRSDAKMDFRDAKAAGGPLGSESVVDASTRLLEAQQAQSRAQRDLAVAIQETGRAMTTAGQAEDAFAAAMAKLSPNAREFVNQMRALGPEWKSLRTAVQERLFDGLGDQVTKVARQQLPELQRGMVFFAGLANGLFVQTIRRVSDTFTEFSRNGTFDAFMKSVADSFSGFVPVIDAVIRALTALTIGIGPEIGIMFQKLAQYIGDTTPFFTRLGETATTTLGDFFGILTRIFLALEPMLQATMPMFILLMSQLTGILEGNQDQLMQLVEAVGTFLTHMVEVFGFMAPVLIPALEHFMEILSTFPPEFVAGLLLAGIAMRTLMIPMIGMGNMIGRSASAWRNITLVWARVVAGARALRAGLMGVTAAQAAQNAAAANGGRAAAVPMAQRAARAVGGAGRAVGTGILAGMSAVGSGIASGFSAIATGAANNIKLLGATVSSGLATASKNMSALAASAVKKTAAIKAATTATLTWQIASTAASQTWGWLKGLPARLMAVVKGINLAAMATKIWTAAQVAFIAVTTMNPIALIIIAIVALVAAFVLAYNKSEQFRKGVHAVLNGLRAAWDVAFAAMRIAVQIWWTYIQVAFQGIRLAVGIFIAYWKVVYSIWKGIFLAIVEVVKMFWETFKLIFLSLKDVATGFINFFKAVFTGQWGEAWEAITGMMGSIVGRFKSFFGAIGNGMSNLKNIAVGVARGIRDAFKGVVDVIKAPIKLVGKLLKKLPKKVWRFDVPGVATLHRWGDALQNLNSGGRAGRKASGMLWGPGTGTSDEIMGVSSAGVPTAMVSPGEYVVNAKSSRKHSSLIEAINRDALPRRADGGWADGAWDLPAFNLGGIIAMLPRFDEGGGVENSGDDGTPNTYNARWHAFFQRRLGEDYSPQQRDDFVNQYPKIGADWKSGKVEPPTEFGWAKYLESLGKITPELRAFNDAWFRYFEEFAGGNTPDTRDAFLAKYPWINDMYRSGQMPPDGWVPPRASDVPQGGDTFGSTSTDRRDPKEDWSQGQEDSFTDGLAPEDLDSGYDDVPSDEEYLNQADPNGYDYGPVSSGGGSASGEALDRATAYAQSVGDGRPYVYGAIDCSGYMSGIYSAFMGLDDSRKFTTESDFLALGFAEGLQDNAFNIGVHRGGGGPNSHMAGTMPDGTPVESGGAHSSVLYGGAAAGADDSQFELHYSLPANSWNPPGQEDGGFGDDGLSYGDGADFDDSEGGYDEDGEYSDGSYDDSTFSDSELDDSGSDEDAIADKLSVPKMFGRAGEILGEGLLDAFGLSSSILSGGNVYNKAVTDSIKESEAAEARRNPKKKKKRKGSSGSSSDGDYGDYGDDEGGSGFDSTWDELTRGGESGSGGDVRNWPQQWDPGQGAEQWRDLMAAVFQFGGFPMSNLQIGIEQMQDESGGNPNAINNSDSNAAAGTPSIGLLQVIKPTFEAYRSGDLKDDQRDPAASIYAGTNYAINRYSPDLSGVWGSGAGGYAAGGPVFGPGGPTADQVAAWLSDGEFVMNAASTSAGGWLMGALNSNPQFASTLSSVLGAGYRQAPSYVSPIGRGPGVRQAPQHIDNSTNMGDISTRSDRDFIDYYEASVARRTIVSHKRH